MSGIADKTGAKRAAPGSAPAAKRQKTASADKGGADDTSRAIVVHGAAGRIRTRERVDNLTAPQRRRAILRRIRAMKTTAEALHTLFGVPTLGFAAIAGTSRPSDGKTAMDVHPFGCGANPGSQEYTDVFGAAGAVLANALSGDSGLTPEKDVNIAMAAGLVDAAARLMKNGLTRTTPAPADNDDGSSAGEEPAVAKPPAKKAPRKRTPKDAASEKSGATTKKVAAKKTAPSKKAAAAKKAAANDAVSEESMHSAPEEPEGDAVEGDDVDAFMGLV